MLHEQQFIEILENITYLNWKVRFKYFTTGTPYLQWEFKALDTDTGEMTLQKSRKWVLSGHMIPQEVERTAWLALEQAVHHEMSENYKYGGVAIRHPHMNPDFIVDAYQNQIKDFPFTVSRPDNN